ncbi:MAG: N-acetylmuramoyl-L-alanine amidase [Candidatus Eremiobacteraeota bacterium]|nr:N-acetylmuramoyl-L-alanine amidase [Candidatus Eremiobacteraeota bacterium]
MRLVFCLLTWLLLAVPALAQRSYDNDDIEQMKWRYEGRPRARAKAHGKLPRRLAEREYVAPRLKDWLLPYKQWNQEYRAYFKRHYGDTRLTFKPEMIVMHYTVVPSARSVWDGFARGANMSAGDQGTVWGHVSVQLMIDRDGTIYRLLPLDRRCTGAYGVNHKALSIEMVARDEADLLSHDDQVFASFCLVRWLMEEYDIPASKVVAHYEVSQGKSVVPEYMDLADSTWPDGYPPSSARTDPGPTYMKWLRSYLRKTATTR